MRTSRKDYHRVYYQKNRERLKAAANARRLADVEADRRRKREDRAEHPEKFKAKDAAYYRKNKAAIYGRVRVFAVANPERVRQYKRNHIKNNPEKTALRREKYREANREVLRLKNRAYRLAHPEMGVRHNHARRARKLAGCVGSGDRKAYDAFSLIVRRAARIRCYWCRSVTPKKDRTLDHIIPLAKGGADDVHNLCCACRSCNAKKNAKLPEQFSGQFHLQFVAPERRV